jgi:hypothetical protein
MPDIFEATLRATYYNGKSAVMRPSFCVTQQSVVFQIFSEGMQVWSLTVFDDATEQDRVSAAQTYLRKLEEYTNFENRRIK